MTITNDTPPFYSLVYSCGSLYTSIIPCLALRGVGHAIRSSQTLRHKVLLLNGSCDRETPGYDAVDFVNAIHSALIEHGGEAAAPSDVKDFV